MQSYGRAARLREWVPLRIVPPVTNRERTMTQMCALRARAAAGAAAATLLIPVSLFAQAGGPVGHAAFDSAWYAWQAGSYVDALTSLDRLLDGPDAHRFLEPAAVLTGEVFRTVEVTTDGRSVAWSPDGRHVSWETGSGAERRAYVARIEDGRAAAAVALGGHSAAFDERGRVFYIQVPDSPELTAARGAVQTAVESRNSQEAFRARTRVSQLEAAGARLMFRDLATGTVSEVNVRGVVPQAVVFRAGDSAL